MNTLIRPNPFAIIGAHAFACLPLSFSMIKERKEALKILCCSIFARAVEEYFQPFCFEPWAPMLIGFCATAAVQTWGFREDKPLPLMQAAYLNLGARAVIWVTSAASLGAQVSTGSIVGMGIGFLGGAAISIWAVNQIARVIFADEKPKTA